MINDMFLLPDAVTVSLGRLFLFFAFALRIDYFFSLRLLSG